LINGELKMENGELSRAFSIDKYSVGVMGVHADIFVFI